MYPLPVPTSSTRMPGASRSRCTVSATEDGAGDEDVGSPGP